MIALPLLAWMSSGLAAVALAPRNRAAQALCVAGTLLPGSWLVQSAAGELRGGAASAALLQVGADVLFLGGLAAVVAVLATFPRGEFSRRWHRRTVQVMAGLAMVGPLAQLVGSPILRIGLDTDTEIANAFAADALAPLGAVGGAVVASEQVWLLVGVAILALRWWRGPVQQRPELRSPLLSLMLLAALLVVLAVSSVTGAALAFAVFDPLFLIALALFPVVLLLGISRRTRGLDAELAASRTRIIEAEDRARRQVERDLHDGVQQQLVAILSLTGLAAQQVRRDAAAAELTLGEVRGQVRTAIRDLRELVHGIRPPVLEDSGVAAAVESRLARLPAEVSLDVEQVRHRRWPPETEAAAYFVVCEAVTNALKHAPGSAVRIALRGDETSLTVEVDDTGPGIHAGARHGRGLAGLRDRVESLGGTFSVTGEPRHGTAVRAHFAPGPVS